MVPYHNLITVTEKQGLTRLIPWIESMPESAHHNSGYLIANKSDLPGRRRISKEDAEDFANYHHLEYHETSVQDEGDSIHDLFKIIVERSSLIGKTETKFNSKDSTLSVDWV